MYISSMDVEDSVLAIFREFHIPVGGRLAQATLVKEWSRLGRRHGDLAEGMQRLVRLASLRVESTADGDVAVLTEIGFERMHLLRRPRLVGWHRSLRSWLQRTLRPEPRRPAAGLPRRRLRDRVAPQV